MKITLTLNPSELRSRVACDLVSHGGRQKALRVVVIDVLRACSTITHALSQGARAIYPFVSVRECLQKAKELGGGAVPVKHTGRGRSPDLQNFFGSGDPKLPAGELGRAKVILGGERGGLKIKGFQLGNSPLEYSREAVEGKSILFTTTNCTKNLEAVARLRQTKEVLICSLLNLPAVADYLVRGMESSDCVAGGLVHLALSGTEGEVSLEDVVCGGMLIHRLAGAYGHTPLLSDSAHLAHVTYLHYKDNPHQALLDSTHGRRLIGLGMKRDVDFCGQVGIYDLVPRHLKGAIM